MYHLLFYIILVHLQLHLYLRDHQGQVHAEQAGPATLRLPPVSHPQQDHQRSRTFYRSSGKTIQLILKMRAILDTNAGKQLSQAATDV